MQFDMFRRDQDRFSGEWLAQQLSWSAALAILLLAVDFAGLHLLRRSFSGIALLLPGIWSAPGISWLLAHEIGAKTALRRGLPVDPARTTSIGCNIMQLRLLLAES